MPEIEPYREPESPLMRFAAEASQVHGIAKALATTSFVPKAFQGRPDEITGAILAGSEIGLPPMTALRTIHVIEGRPSLEANAMRGLALAAGCKFELLESTATRCVMRAIAPGSDNWTTVVWTIERAKQMGLAGKSNWSKMPQSMLVARATSELCRLIAANLFLGLPYSVEELKDGGTVVEIPSTVESAEAPKTRTMRREPIQATVGEPQYEEIARQINPIPEVIDTKNLAKEIAAEPEAAPEPTAPGGITATTRASVMASFKDAGVTDRTARLQRVGQVVGREVHSVNQLSEDEGRKVVRDLKGGDDKSWGVPASEFDWPETAPVQP